MTTHSHDSHDHGDAHGHDDHGHGGVGKYVVVFLILCLLTAISFGVASTESIMNTPSIGWSIMMAVSCAKAFLVIAFFMHMIWEANWKYVLTIPASIMSCFLVLMLVPDVGYRTRHYSSERLRYAAPANLEEHKHEGEHQHGPKLPYNEQDLKSTATESKAAHDH